MASYGTEPLPSKPYSLDLLADLHAGALDESVSSRLWPLVREDPDAAAVLDALDAVSARLSASGQELAHGEPMPAHVAERIDRALAAADLADHPSADHPSPVTTLRSRRRNRTVVAASVAAAVALVAVVTSSVLGNRAPENVVADPVGPAAEPPALVLDPDSIDATVAFDVLANSGPNSLADSGALAGCLTANGFDSATKVIGAAPIELDGRTGVMLVIPRRETASGGLTLLAVDDDCRDGNPGTLVRRDID